MAKRKKSMALSKQIVQGAIATSLAVSAFGLMPVEKAEAASIWNYGYTGSAQEFTAPYTGTYQFEVWGAQGNYDAGNPGEGGYAKGTKTLTAGEKVYVYVGGQGSRFNGGGWSTHSWVMNGSGATDIRTSSDGNWQNNLQTRLIVAGAGGSAEWSYAIGGAGGGTTGGTGNANSGTTPTGGSQTSGGAGLYAGGFGYGGYVNSAVDIGGPGGGGWYGGGSGSSTGGGGGGSSYVGGVTNGSTLAGNQTMPAPGGGTELGHSGSGYARISFVNGGPGYTLTSDGMPSDGYYKAGQTYAITGTIYDTSNVGGNLTVKTKIGDRPVVTALVTPTSTSPKPITINITIPNDLPTGVHTLGFYLYDDQGAETVTGFNISVMADTTKPVVTSSLSTTAWTKNDVVITANATDIGGTGIGQWKRPDNSVDSSGASSSTYTVTQNGTYAFIATDKAGNATTHTVTVANIDKALPTLTLTANPTTPTNSNVTITANGSDALSGVKRIKLPDGNYVTGASATYAATANGTFAFEVEDNAGNVVSKSITISNIDKTAPGAATFSADKTTPTNGNVNVTVNFPSDVVDKQYKIGDTGTWASYTAPITLTANETVYARSLDAAGNVSKESIYVVNNIDKTAPVVATFKADKTAYTNEKVVVTIQFPSDASVKEYKTGFNGEWIPYTSPIEVTQNNTSVYARSKDAAGNISEENWYNVTNIDKTAPVVDITTDIKELTNQNVTITVQASDGQLSGRTPKWYWDSNVKRIKLPDGTYVNNPDFSDAPTERYTTASYVAKENGTYTFVVEDGAGNITEKSVEITNIDKTAPTSATLVASTSEVTNKDVLVTIKYPSDAVVKEYRTFGGEWHSYLDTPVVFQSNGTIEARSKDSVGNYSEISKLTISNIDKTAPLAPTITADITNATSDNVKVTIRGAEQEGTVQYRVNGGAWTEGASVNLSANATVEARQIDGAGNTSEVGSLVVNNIDKVAPERPVATADKTMATNEDVKVTVTYPSDASQKLYRIGHGSWEDYTTAITVSHNAVVTLKAVDEAGNTSESSIEIANIDKKKPTEPKIEVNVDKVTVIPGTDESGIEKTLIQVNGGQWISYTAPIQLNDGEYSVKAKSIDKVGNETEVSHHFFVYDDTLKQLMADLGKFESYPNQATKTIVDGLLARIPDSAPEKPALVERARVASSAIASKEVIVEIGGLERTVNNANAITSNIDQLKADLQALKSKVNAMSDSDKKTEFLAKLQVLENKIVALEQVKIISNNAGKTEEVDLGALEDALNQLPEGDMKDRLEEQVENAKIVAETNTKLDQLEETPNRNDLEAIKQTTKDMPNSPEKTAILERVTEVENQLNAEDLVKYLESTNSTASYNKALEAVEKVKDPVAKQELLDRIQQANETVPTVRFVENAEKYRGQENINKAREEINKLPDGELKEDLYERLDKIDTQLKLATNSVNIAETSMTLSNIAKAEEAVNALVDSPQKKDLLDRLTKAKEVLSDRAKENTVNLDLNATPENIKAAEEAAKKMPNGPEKTEILEKIEEVKVQKVSDSLVESVLESVTPKKYEEALASIEKIKDEVVRQELLDRLEVVKEEVEVMTSVENSVSSRSQANIDEARQKVNELPDGELKDALYESLNKVDTALKSAELKLKIGSNSMTATYLDKAEQEINELVDSPQKEALLDALEIAKKAFEDKEAAKLLDSVESKTKLAEKYKTKTYLVSALTLANSLPDSQAKTDILSRLNVVAQQIGYKADSSQDAVNSITDAKAKKLFSDWTSAVIRAEKSATRYAVSNMVRKMNAITDSIKNDPKYATLYDELSGRTEAVKSAYDAKVAEATLKKAISKAESQVKYYEKYRRENYKIKAQTAVNALPDGDKKSELQARIEAVLTA